uniref:Selenoprotein M n=1 Tax=Sarcophilus harrisii TaxID=9305 RepID=A0A7N4PRH5_SARHA
MRRLLPLLLLPGLFAAFQPDWNQIRGLARGRVEVRGLSPRVKLFVTQDVPYYHNLVLKYFPGADPELVLLGYQYEELERIPLRDMTREEINQLLKDLGFYRKSSPDAPVPPEFQYAPARVLGEKAPTPAPHGDSIPARLEL